MGSRLCTILGWQMLDVAVGWHVYALTHDPLALGLVGLSEFLSFFSLVLVGGHTADHFNRRRILMVAALVEVGCALSLLWFALHGLRGTWPVYAAMAVFGGTRAFWAPAIQAMLVNIVPREDLAPAVATDSTLRQISVISGPAIGGALYLLGPEVVYAACATMFTLSLIHI